MPDEKKSDHCPNCETEMISGEGAGILLCPVCHFTEQTCPRCGGRMGQKVEVPEGVEIGTLGLPLGFCRTVWICRDTACGHRVETEG